MPSEKYQADSGTDIQLGIDGWSGILGESFTVDNVRRVVNAMAHYIVNDEDATQGVCVGWDARFQAQRFAHVAADVLSKAGIPVTMASTVTPVAALSYAVVSTESAGGVMISSNHDQTEWNGVMYKGPYGGAGSMPMMARISTYLDKPRIYAEVPGAIRTVDILPRYLEYLRESVDLDRIAQAKPRVAIDSMHGAGADLLPSLLRQAGMEVLGIRTNPHPLLLEHGCTEEALAQLKSTVVENGFDVGFATDNNAGRVAAVDGNGEYVDSHKLFAIMLQWLLEKPAGPGGVSRSFNASGMLDRICARYGRKLFEHGVGFEYVSQLMLQEDILMGGGAEGEIGLSQHMPEHDGIFNVLLVLYIMAERGKSLSELVSELQETYGAHHYGHIEIPLDEVGQESALERAHGELPRLVGMPLNRMEILDGNKLFLRNPEAKRIPNAAETWLVLRASTVDPILRVYAESCSRKSVLRILEAVRTFAQNIQQRQAAATGQPVLQRI